LTHISCSSNQSNKVITGILKNKNIKKSNSTLNSNQTNIIKVVAKPNYDKNKFLEKEFVLKSKRTPTINRIKDKISNKSFNRDISNKSIKNKDLNQSSFLNTIKSNKSIKSTKSVKSNQTQKYAIKPK
jgi:hypothetical protein